MRVLRIPDAPLRLQYPKVVAARDPFVADPKVAQQLSRGTGALVLASGAPENGAIVQAIVLGQDPRALVDRNGSVAVVGIGDALAGSAVVSIDPEGISLANGLRIGLVKGSR